MFLSPPLSSTPLGTVVKLDGLYAAVLFPTINEGEGPDEEGDKSVLSHCRLLRREDLVVCTIKCLIYIIHLSIRSYQELVPVLIQFVSRQHLKN